MTKRISFILFILLTLMPMAGGYAQNTATAIDSLVIELWPDYDKASVLVLLTGTLPNETQLPATVTLPLPETAQFHVVARIDTRDGTMKNDISWVPGRGLLMFTTPDSRFRLEYYFPYEVNGDQRSFDYTWLADLSVRKLELRVQQPSYADFLMTDAPAVSVVRGEDGFNYHALPARVAPAGQPVSVHVAYTMTTAKLSIESLGPSNASVQEPGVPSGSKVGVPFGWLIITVIVSGVILVIVFVWQMAAHRATPSRSITNQAKAKKKGSHPIMCHHCGNLPGKDDNFCPKCGSAL